MRFSVYLAALFTLLFFPEAYSQEHVIDSLKIILKNPKVHDTVKLKSISDVMQMYYTENDKDYYYLNSLAGNILDAGEKKKVPAKVRENYTLWRAAYYSTRGVEYLHRKDKANGLPFFDKSIALFKSVGAMDEAYFHTVAKASLYTRMHEYEKAIACIMPALKYFEKAPEYNADELSYTLTGLAFIYLEQGKYEKSIEYNRQVLKYQEILNRDYPQAEKDYLKGKVYYNIASAYVSLKKYPEAIQYGITALKLIAPIGDKTLEGIILCRMGSVKMKMKDYDGAEKMFKQALEIDSKHHAINDVAIAGAYQSLAKLYYYKKDLPKAALYAKKAYELSEKTGSLDVKKGAATAMYNVSKKTGDYKTALEMFELMDRLDDSDKLQESKHALEEQMMKYDFEKKELKLKLEAERAAAVKNNWLIGLSGLILLLVLGGYFYYRNIRQKQEIAKLEKNRIKQKLLLSQMNPHFIFNSVQNIQGLINSHKNDEAVNYLGKFSKLTRQILENSGENYIALADELDMIKNYISIQQLLYGNSISYTLNVDDAIDTESVFLPPMLTQPFIENAIKHGLKNKHDDGMLAMRFYLQEGKLFFEVTDNGLGFDAGSRDGNHKSMATAITKERLVNYTGNADFEVRTENITNNGNDVLGAKVVFEVPYIYED